MEDYKLKHHELSDLMHLNFDFSYLRYSFYFNKGYGESKKGWENPEKYVASLQSVLLPFFNPLLQKQPELANYVEQYWEESKTEPFAEHLFDRIFSEKILLKNVYQYVLKDRQSMYVTDKDRKQFIKNMINQEPWLINEAHIIIKNNTPSDNILIQAYMESLKNHIHEIKDSKESIWANMKKVKHHFDSTSTALLTSVIKAFAHEKEYYQTLKDVFSPQFEIYHGLREKFKKYEEKYFSAFKVEEHIDLFENQQEYRYILDMKDRVLIDNFGIHKGATSFIKSEINKCIEEYFKKAMPNSSLSFQPTDRGFEIVLSNADEKNILNSEMNKFNPVIIDMISSLDKNTKQFPNKDCLAKVFESAVLKLEMDESLDKKSDVKPKKAKL